jgi:hypothetical protein
MRDFKRLSLIAIIIVISNIIAYLFIPKNSQLLLYISDLLPVLTSGIAVAFLLKAFIAFKTCDSAKIAWLLILFGMVLNFLAESVYAFYELVLAIDMNELYPSLADYIWSLAYLPLIIGFAIVIHEYRKSDLPMGNVKSYSFVIAGLILLVVIVGYFLISPIVRDSEIDNTAKFFYIIYPVADLILVILIISLRYMVQHLGDGNISDIWRLMIIGFISMTLADLLYSYLSWMNMYDSGNFIDIAWNAGYLFIALAAVKQRQLIRFIRKEACYDNK